jgi:polysaccharide chain length determinant protein (PEP-CTERM system associated)
MLLNELRDTASGIVDAIWRHRWAALATAWGVGLVGVAAVAVIPDRYEANARLYVDTQTVLKPLMTGLAFQPDVDQQVRILAKTLVSRPNVEKLLKDPQLQFDQSRNRHEELVDALMRKIKIESQGAGNIYALSYRDTDPARAKRLVETMMNLFVTSGTQSKQRDSQDASKFIDEQIKANEAKLTESENRLKDFKLRNFGVSGTGNQDYFARISALSDEIGRLRIALSAAENGRDAIKRELAREEPLLPIETPAHLVNAPRSELDTRLDAQRRQLDELLRRYTEQHPDVIAARRTVAQLEQQQKQEYEAQKKSGARGGNAPTNPVFQRLRMSLTDAEANIASLRSQLSAQQVRLGQLRATASRVPQAEAELAQLNRDYEIIRKNYEQLVARRESASLGVKIDESSQAAEFRVVEPPKIGPWPIFPSRLVLSIMAIMAALLAGAAVAYALDQLKPAVRRIRDLRAIAKRPVLGAVTLTLDSKGKAAARADTRKVVGLTMLLLTVQVVTIIWVALHGRV